MQIQQNASLKDFHTFSIDVTCELLVIVESIEDLKEVYLKESWRDLKKVILGKGSNVLFTKHFEGIVIINRIEGKTASESDDAWLLHIEGGEDWPTLVKWTIDKGYYGLENLALIPGCAGSAPIQNIGAYGVEFKDVCQYVEVLELNTLKVTRLLAKDCQFGYRDSIFKHSLYGKVVIVAIGIELPKLWHPKLSYGNLKAIPEAELTAEKIFDEICAVRMQKLPDPNQIGNAGSFFKNPLITMEHYDTLRQIEPELVAYPAGDKMKIAAGWLIDQCGMKGAKVGGAMVHKQQALVITNIANATAEDVTTLAQKVCDAVMQRYQISLEHEVRFYNSQQETYLKALTGTKE